MKKYLLLFLGTILSAIALSKLSLYVSDYEQLTSYGKGYIWGNLFILLAGLTLLFLGFRIKQSQA